MTSNSNNKKKNILLVFGTRPEAIKMAPLVKEFQKYPDIFNTSVCVTAQHREMLDQVLSIFEIVPDYDLNLMKQGQDLYDITSGVLLGMREVIKKCSPKIVFVHGDTTTSTATALAAFYQQIPVAHIEAGLRTHDKYSPWPEEINRQITGRITTYHFAPTEGARQNLLKEHLNGCEIIVTGNTVIDALFMVLDKINKSTTIHKDVSTFLSQKGIPLEYLDLWATVKRKLILVTGHRRENFGDGFLNICSALKSIAEKNPDADIVYPVHLNPNVQKPVYELLKQVKNIFLIEPLEYLPFVYLMSKSYLVLTDSGGIQEEAPGLGKPVLVMRNTTERPEAVEAGTVKLVGTDKELIISETNKLLDDFSYYNKMSQATNPYGDGKACERIINYVK